MQMFARHVIDTHFETSFLEIDFIFCAGQS